MTLAMLGSYNLRLTPCMTIVCTGTHHHHQVLPVTGSFYPIEVEKRSLTIIKNRRTSHVTVRHFIEKFCRRPFGSSLAETGRQNHHTTSILLISREPYGQQVTIVTPSYGRLMVVMIKRRIRTNYRFLHIYHRLQEIRFGQVYCRKRQWFITLHYTEASQRMFVFRNHGQTVGTTKIFIRSMVTTPTCHTEFSFSRAYRIGLFFRRVWSIPIQAPFFHIAMHVIKAERIWSRLSHFQRYRFIITGYRLVTTHIGRQSISCIE